MPQGPIVAASGDSEPRRSRPEVTQAVTRGAMRRADILALSPAGRVVIVEVKSGIADWRADSKWSDYGAFCDGLAFAVASDFPANIIPDEVGLIVADAYGGAVIREPVETPLPPARRRAILMRFAALAADRLQAVIDPVADEMLR